MSQNQHSQNKDFVPPPEMDFDLPEKGRYEKKISPCNRKTALLLALFGGVFAAHDFYLGYKKRAKIRIILLLLILPSVILPWWAIYDIIKMLSGDFYDGEGRIVK